MNCVQPLPGLELVLREGDKKPMFLPYEIFVNILVSQQTAVQKCRLVIQEIYTDFFNVDVFLTVWCMWVCFLQKYMIK